MEKAKIFVASKNGELVNPELYMDVMFNPETYSVSSSAEYTSSAAPGQFTDVLQFTKLATRKLSFELVFDTMNGKARETAALSISSQLKDVFADSAPDVSVEVNKLHKLIETQKDGDVTYPPPVVIFAWGSFSFIGVIDSFTENYTMFQLDGSPVRAMVAITIQEYNSEKAKKAADSVINKKMLGSQELEDDLKIAKEKIKTMLKSLL